MKYKNFTLLLLATILTTNVFSQPTITKQKDIGGINIDYFASMDLTKDGGLIIGGYSNSNVSGQKSDTNRGRFDYWIIKLDSLQHIQWDKTIGGNYDDYLKSVKQTADGGYILGGYSLSKAKGDKTQNNLGGFDYWVVKLNSTGVIQWDKTIGGNKDDYLESATQTTDGGYILGGFSNSDSSGNKTANPKGHYDYWVVKLNSKGIIQWDKTIGGNGEDELASIAQTSEGGYILGGSSDSHISGDKTEHNKGYSDYWVVKLNNLGSVEWDKTIGGRSVDELTSIVQTDDNGYAAGGYSISDSSGNKTQNSKGAYDYWVVKLNGSGHIQWNKTIGGRSNDELSSIKQTKDEGYILGGYSFSNSSGDKTENSMGAFDYWIVKINKNGILQWDKTIGGSINDYVGSTEESKKNSFVIGGYSMSNISGDKTMDNKGKLDYWIVYLDYTDTAQSITSSNKINLQNATTAAKSFSTYPNPVKNILYVQSKAEAVFSLTDQSGKTLLTKIINGNGEINVADLNPGLYYLKNNETGLSQKVVVVK